MGMVTGGQLVARMLKEERVRHVFTLSGLHVAPIYAGLVEEGIQVIDTRHEQGAAHAANSPLILLGGAAPQFNQSRGSLQEMEQVDLFHRISKWSDRVPSPDLVPLYMAKAFRVALSGRPGPVFLELAWDVLGNGVDEETLQIPRLYRTRARIAPDPRAVDEALALLAAAERPAMIAGSSVWWDDAPDALRAFVERAQIPTYLNGAGRGCLPPDHPMFFQHTRKEALTGADVVFVVGTPFDFRLNYGAEPTFSAASKIVQVDIDATEVGRNRPVDVGIVADSRSALAAFADGAQKATRTTYLAELRAAEEKKIAAMQKWIRSDAVPIHHYRLAKELSDVANAGECDPMFIADGGNWVALAAKVLSLKAPGRWLDPGPLGCL